MKKILSLTLVLALTLPTSAFAVTDPSLTERRNEAAVQASELFGEIEERGNTANPVTGLDSIVNTSDVVGCQTGGFGGALAQTFGAALQQAIPGFIRGQLSGPLNELASQAGPFGGLISSVGNIAVTKLSDYVQGQIGDIFSSITGSGAGSTVGSAAGSLAENIGGSVSSAAAGIGAGSGAVPVNTVSINELVRKIDTQTKATQDATETESQKECIGDVVARKLANEALSFLFKSTVDFVNSGFDGETAIIQNLEEFAGRSAQVLVEDFIDTQLSGMCSTQRPTVQRLLLSQYQYETNFGKRVQCRSEYEDGVQAFESGTVTLQNLFDSVFTDQLTIDKYFAAQSELVSREASEYLTQSLNFVTNDGYKNKIVCSNTGQPPRSGVTCTSAEGTPKTVFPGSLTSSIVQKQFDVPTDTLLNADEIAEIIDALTAAVTQVALQGVDGLFGLTKSRGSQGSYLDDMVGGSRANSQNAAREALLRDIESAVALEESYVGAVGAVLDELTRVRALYQSALQCLAPKAVSGSNPAVAQVKLANASSTIATVIDPQIRSLTVQENRTLKSIDNLDTLYSETQTALTPAQLVALSGRYNALVQAGALHTPSDLALLEAGLIQVRDALYILAVDAAALKTECQAL